MSNINTTYALFNVYDYKNESVLSSYNLDITPLTFIADITDGENHSELNTTEAIFDFGDGSIATGLTATHSYSLPGQYKVRMVLSDCENNAVLASYSTNVNIYDYIENTFTVDIADNHLPLSAGEFSKPIDITNKAPFYQTSNLLNYSVSGFTIPNYFDIIPYKFNHLKRYYSFYRKEYINNLSANEYVEVSNLSVSGSNIYIKLSGNKLVDATSTESGSVFVGTSGKNTFYFKSDEVVSNRIDINLFKDRDTIFSRSKDLNYSLNNYNNNLSITLTANIGDTSFPSNLSALSINDNGLTGEGAEEAQIFNLSPIQFKTAVVPFCIKPNSISDYTVKNLTLSENVTARLYNASDEEVDSSYYSITNLANTISSVDTDFWFYGNFTYNDNLSSVETLTLRVSADYTNDSSQNISLTGKSNSFDLYPKDYYYFAKQNEDVDFTDIFKSLRFQEILLDDDVLFDDFIGSIFGNISSNYTSFGKTLNEKIFNFSDNKIDIDKCNISSLINFSNLLNQPTNIYDSTLVNFPIGVIRYMNMFSTDYNIFRGTTNKFKENFSSRGVTTKELYGKNLGKEINTTTYTVTAGIDIVALEKFSNKYSILNTFQPVSSKGAHKYNLSGYDTSWGWPLVLPTAFTFDDISKYYTFYEYTSGYEGTVVDGIVNFKDILTTFDTNTTLSSFKGDNNIEDIVLRNTLFSSLSII